MYGLIFGCVESRIQLERICLVLGSLYFQSKRVGFFRTPRDCTTIEEMLGMKAGDLVSLLDPILSLVTIEGDNITSPKLSPGATVKTAIPLPLTAPHRDTAA